MQLNDIFSVDGLLKQRFPTYQIREGQVKMATLVQKSLQDGKSAVIEGATGVGKGFGYLIPLIISGETVIVSTSNKSLQDQLDRKDLPTLQEVFGKPLSWTVLKGKSNYFCHEHFETNKDEIRNELLRSDREYDFSDADLVIQQLAKWAEEETIGDLEYLPFEIPFKVRELICCDNNTTHEKGSDGAKFCFASKARERAKNSQIVLVNHTLLALDINLRKESDGKAGILPKTDAVVIDEAHEFEKQAVLAFSDEISLNSLYHLLNWTLVKKTFPSQKQKALANDLRKALDAYRPDWGGKYYSQRKEPFFAGLEPVIDGIGGVIRALSSLKEAENEKVGAKVREIIKEAENLQERLKEMGTPDENMLRWSEARDNAKGDPVIRLKSVPLDISDLLRFGLFQEKIVICTSATLSVHGKFDFFKSQVGFPDDCYELIVESPFDYKKNALCYITAGLNDMPPDNSRQEYRYWEVEELIRMSQGRAFVLTTSYSDMNTLYDVVRTDHPKIKQGQDGMTRQAVLELWKNTPNAVLFATKSFWEGVDIVGDKLSLVVIWKIPFENPRDLVFSSKCEKIDAKYGRRGISFIKYAIPDACIRLKQGAGRLIRSVNDKGVIALMDARVNYANYKDMVIDALPPAYRTQQLHKVENFFSRINNEE